MSWFGTGTKMWRVKPGYWDPNPDPLDKWISNDNTDIYQTNNKQDVARYVVLRIPRLVHL